MKSTRSWWRKAGECLNRHPELLESAKGIRGFGGGAVWMRKAMIIAGWKLPPKPGDARFRRLGILKYGACFAIAAAASFFASLIWLPAVPFVAAFLFYAVEAQSVFLFPEAILGRKSPWLSSRALTLSAGGTLKVMTIVLPIALRMLTAAGFRSHPRRAWIQGCLAVVLWHRHTATHRRLWTEQEKDCDRFEIGPSSPLLLRREAIGPGPRCAMLWISDLHWLGNGDRATLLALRGIARKTRPDLILLGGDYVDHEAALPLLRLLVRCLARTAPVVALPGNHDMGRFRDAVRQIIVSSDAFWLPDHRKLDFNIHGASVEIITAAHTAEAIPPETLRIVAVHNPAELDGTEIAAGSLVISGHLHGGQCVFHQSSGRLFPAAWFYHHAWLRRHFRGADWITSRGAGDTVPIRWNCPREILLCERS